MKMRNAPCHCGSGKKYKKCCLIKKKQDTTKDISPVPDNGKSKNILKRKNICEICGKRIISEALCEICLRPMSIEEWNERGSHKLTNTYTFSNWDEEKTTKVINRNFCSKECAAQEQLNSHWFEYNGDEIKAKRHLKEMHGIDFKIPNATVRLSPSGEPQTLVPPWRCKLHFDNLPKTWEWYEVW